MQRRAFWALVGELDAQIELDVTWDAELYDEPDDRLYWAYVHLGPGGPVVAHLSDRPFAFLRPDAPPIVRALLERHGVQVLTVPDLNHKTYDLTPALHRALGRRPAWTSEDLHQLLAGLEALGLRRGETFEDSEGVVLTTNTDGRVVAFEHLYVPFAVTFETTPPHLGDLLRAFGYEVVTVRDLDTPTLSIDLAALPELTARLDLLISSPSEVRAFSAADLIYMLR